MKSSGLWFIIGQVVGIALLLAAIRLLPSGWFRPQTALSAQVQKEQLQVLRKLNSLTDQLLAQQQVTPSAEVREAALSSDLQTVRAVLELYKVQHNDQYPAPPQFVAQLTGQTNANGDLRPAGAPANDYPFGPYLQHFPVNACATKDAQTVKVGNRDSAPGDGTSGWYYNPATGGFWANDSKTHAEL